MNNATLSIAVGLVVLFFAATAEAQRKPPARKPAPKPTPVRSTPIVPPLDVRAARERVAIQVDNVNLFVDKLGPIAQSIEEIDESAKKRPLPKKTADTNATNKKKVIAAIRNLRAGLAELETDFRTKPVLQRYLPSIEGITDLGAASEDSALAGKFVASKDPLRDIAKKLADTLAVLPSAGP